MLYNEGFGQHCEHLMLGRDSWGCSYSADWPVWCQEHLGELAAEFLRRVDAGESVRPFFGSWCEVQGRKQTGYFLGHEVIRRLQAIHNLREVALLEGAEVNMLLRQEVERLADQSN